MKTNELWLYFKSPEMTAREYITFSKNVLSSLAQFDPLFGNFFGWGFKANARKHIASDMNDFDEIVFEQIYDKNIVYENPDKNNKEFTWDSKSFIGYGNSYSNTTRIKEGQFTISIRAGGEKSTGILSIEFPACNYPRFSEYNYVRKLFLHCIQLLNPTYGFILSDELLILNQSKKDEIDIGWFTYLRRKDVLNILPENIHKEEIENGTLFLLSKDIPDIADNKVENKIKEIKKCLMQKNMLNKKLFL